MDGDIFTPSDRASLYTVRPQNYMVPKTGILYDNPYANILGAMVKSPDDAGHMLAILLKQPEYHLMQTVYARAKTDKEKGRVFVASPLEPDSIGCLWSPSPPMSGSILHPVDGPLTAYADIIPLVKGAGYTVVDEQDLPKQIPHYSPSQQLYEDSPRPVLAMLRPFCQRIGPTLQAWSTKMTARLRESMLGPSTTRSAVAKSPNSGVDMAPSFFDFTAGLANPPVHTLEDLIYTSFTPPIGEPRTQNLKPRHPRRDRRYQQDISNRYIDEFDRHHAYRTILEDAVNGERLPPGLHDTMQRDQQGTKEEVSRLGCQILIGPPSRSFLALVNVLDWPSATLPLGYLDLDEHSSGLTHGDGRPFGVVCAAITPWALLLFMQV